MNHPIHCGNCQWTGDLDGDDYVVLDEVPDLGTRLSPGCECPAGECPACGCLVFLGELPTPKEMTVSEALELLKTKIKTDDNAWDAMDVISRVFATATKRFRCPACGGSHFGSAIGDDGKMTRNCHSCRGAKKFTWTEDEDDKYFRWEITLPTGELLDQPREVSTRPGVSKYVATYSHRHGVDLISFRSRKPIEELDADEVAKALKLDWEPDRDEYLSFFYANGIDFPVID